MVLRGREKMGNEFKCQIPAFIRLRHGGLAVVLVALWASFTLAANPLTDSLIVQLLFDQSSGITAPYTGKSSGNGTLTATKPIWNNTLMVPNGGIGAIDFGKDSPTGSAYAVNLPVLSTLQGLKSFTITGWVNCSRNVTGSGGNRILDWVKNTAGATGNQGVQLGIRDDGHLELGFNSLSDASGVSSSSNMIPADTTTPMANWRFFAVTYDTTTVKFYFGAIGVNASLDVSKFYTGNPTVVGGAIAELAIGNRSLLNQNSGHNFRGLMDQIRIYGTKAADGKGVKTLSEIIAIQQNCVAAGKPGLVYEKWENIGGGNEVKYLKLTPTYPENPTSFTTLSNFNAPRGVGDNYGARVSGLVKAPVTGKYVFYLTSDDGSELYLSSDSTVANKGANPIAYLTAYTGYQNWTSSVNATSKKASDSISLTAGKFYYIEALLKENGGDDHLSVGWEYKATGSSTITSERPIPDSRVFIVPVPSDLANYPSQINVYKPGTIMKKGTLGWNAQKDNPHLYLATDSVERFQIKGDIVNIPKKLSFGTLSSNMDYNLGFRWDPTTPESIGSLYLEAGNGQKVFRVEAPSETEPYLEINQRLDFRGPDVILPGTTPETWTAFSGLNYYYGLGFDRYLTTPTGSEREFSLFNGSTLKLQRKTIENGVTTSVDSVDLSANGLQFLTTAIDEAYTATLTLNSAGVSYINTSGTESFSTNIGAGGISTTGFIRADGYVSTPKWKVIPDFVFEKGYKRKSLEELESFVRKHKHLPEIPSAKQMSEEGVDLAVMNLKMLKSIEELTLNVIAINKELQTEKKRNRRLEKTIQNLHSKNEGK